ncbi:retrovirus-related pol polyprotein from transposon TNT 1-94 [Tanacetum coccineum]
MDYDETFAPVARLEAIRIFLAFATYINFIVYQMDVKSAFLKEKLKEEVYVKQPPGFKSSEFPNHVCKLEKAIYGLKQAPSSPPKYTVKVLKDSTKVWFSTVTSYRNAIGANYLAHLKDYAKPPTIETVRKWFPTIGHGRAIEATGTLKKLKKKNREKVIPYPRFLSLLLEHKMKGYGIDEVNLNPTQIFNVLNWSLKKNQSKGPPFTDHILAICNAAEPVAFIAPTSSKLEKKAPKSMPSSNKAVESPTSHSKRKKFGMAKDINPRQPPASTPGVTGTNPNVLVDKTKSIRDGLETTHAKTGTNKDTINAEKEAIFDKDEFNTSPDLSSANDSKEIKLEDLSKLVKDVDVDLMDLNSPEDDEPIILVKEKEEVETEAALLKAQPSFPNVEKLTELLELPSKMSDINGEIKDLRKYIEGLKIEIPVADIKNLQLEFPAEFLALPGQVSSIQVHMSKLKTLDALLSLLNRVTEALDRLAYAIELASNKNGDHGVPSAGQASTHPAEILRRPPLSLRGSLSRTKERKPCLIKKLKKKSLKLTLEPTVRLTGCMVESSKKKHLKKFDFVTEKGDHVHLTEEQIKEQKRIEESLKADMAKKEKELGKEELVNLLGIKVVTNVYKAKIKYDKYCDKMLNRRALGKIINCDVLSKGKGPITLKVYRDDGSDETIPNFKARIKLESLGNKGLSLNDQRIVGDVWTDFRQKRISAKVIGERVRVMSIDPLLELEAVEELLEEEMLVSSSNHWLMVMWRKLVIWKLGMEALVDAMEVYGGCNGMKTEDASGGKHLEGIYWEGIYWKWNGFKLV